MAQATKKKKLANEDVEQQDTAAKTRAAVVQKRQDKIDAIDDVLEEIDSLLEEQEVLVNYRQRGGE